MRQASGRSARYKRIKTWRRVVSILCVIVVFCTTYAMVLPAITLEKTACCGMEEHIHTDECYEMQKQLTCTLEETEGHVHSDACYEERQVLCCPLEETDGHYHTDECYEERQVLCCPLEEDENHVHTDECYAQERVLICTEPERDPHTHLPECYETERVLVCDQEECEPHTHTEDCYEVQPVLVCELPEHTHTESCYQDASDPSADVEGEAYWQQMTAQAGLNGNYRHDVLAIARSQVGYRESERNYTEDPSTGGRSGYTRFGAWYGMPYQPWCAMFVSFCLHYAGVPASEIPPGAACDRWAAELAQQGMYITPDGLDGPYHPLAGDIIFFRNSPGTQTPDHVGIVEGYDEASCVLTTIEGNYSNSVSRVTYDLGDSRIDGYCPMPAQDGDEMAEEPEETPGDPAEKEEAIPEEEPEKTSEQTPGDEPEGEPGEQPEDEPEGESDEQPEEASGEEPDEQPEPETGDETKEESAAPVRMLGAARKAAARGGSSVNDLLTGVALYVDGVKLTGGDWGTLVKGKTYRLELTFRENAGHQFADDDGWMEYDLPPQLQVMNTSSAFDQNLGYFGVLSGNSFEISGGKLRFKWNTADAKKFETLCAADSATVAFNMDIWFDGEVRTIHFGAGLDRTVNLDNPHDASVQKSGYYDPNDQKIHYRVEISSRGESENVHVSDTISGSALTLDGASLSVKDGSGRTVPSSQWGNWSYSPGGFSMDLPDMNDGNRYIVEYTAGVHLDRLGHSGHTTYSETGNTVRITTREDNNPGNNSATNYLYNIQSSDLTKRAGAPGDVYTEGGQKYRDISWSIHANPQKITSVGTITDSIDANSRSKMDFKGTGITVKVTMPNGQVVNRAIPWGTNDSRGRLVLSADGKSWSYTPPASDGSAEYEISYATKVKVESGTVEVTNTVSDNHNTTVEGQFVPGEGGSGGGDEPEDKLDIYKTATTVNDEYIIWTIRIPVPKEGYDSFVVAEKLPNLGAHNDTDPIDRSYGTNGFVIEGLTGNESWTAAETNAGYWTNGPGENQFITDDIWKGITTETITFYKNSSKTQTGLKSTGENREIVLRIKTLNNPDWMEYAQESGNEYAKTHQNTVSVDADGKNGSATASATPLKAKIYKTAATDPIQEPLTVKLKDGREYTAYPYQITVEGVQKEPVEIFDFFDSSMFEVLEISDLASDFNTASCPIINTPALNPQRITPCEGPWGGQPSEVFAQVTDREDGALFTLTDLPKKVDPRTGEQTVYYGFYRMTCYLVLKDEAALKRQAMLAGGTTTFRNTAAYKDSTADVDVEYNYKVISKEAVNGTDSEGNETNRIQHFTISVNPDKLQLNGGNEMELTDTSSPSLAIDYTTIRVTTDPASRHDEVTYDFYDRTGVFRVPDETEVIIEYDANVLGEGLVQFRNDAELDGKYTDYADDTIQMSSAGGGSAEVVAIHLMKYAAEHMEQGTLAGARFRLLDSDRQPILINGENAVFETDGDGPILIWLRQNVDGMTLHKNTVYYLEELEAPEGYARDYGLIPFVISDDTDFHAPEGVGRYYIGDTMGVRNEPLTNQTKLTIVKRFTGNENLTDEQKNRIGFHITGPDDYDFTVSYRDFDDDGSYTVEDLAPGDYTVRETGALEAAEGTDYSVVTTYAVGEGEEQTVTDYSIDGPDFTLTEDQAEAVIFTNDYSTHSYDFTKVDSRTDQPLAGAVFAAFRADAEQQLLTYISGPDGRFRVRYSDTGAQGDTVYRSGVLYYITELTPPEGYVLPPEPERYYFYFGQKPAGAPDGAVDLSTDDAEAAVVNSSDTYLTIRKRWVNSLGEPTQAAPDGVGSLRFRIYRTERIIEHEQIPGDWEVTQAPTCTESGTRVRYCSACGELLETEMILALGHDMGPWEVIQEPTITETGLKRRICARCGYTETEVIPVHTHTPGGWEVTKEATCTESGTKVRCCTGCGAVIDSETIPALGHDYSAAVTAPTCTASGYTTHTCARCGDSYVDSPTAALGHQFVNGICTRCGAEDPDSPPVKTATVTFAAPASWNNEITEICEISANRSYRFVVTMRDWQDTGISSLTVNGTPVAVTRQKVGSNPWHYLFTSEPFTVTGDITVFTRMSGGPDEVAGYEFAAVSGAKRTAARKSASLSVLSASEAAPETPAVRSAAPVTVSMTPAQLQDYLTEQGAVPYGDEFTVTEAEGWTKTISDLPKRQGYTEYTYYVVELDSEGYGYHLVGYDGEGTDLITATNQTEPTSFVLPETGGTGTTRCTLSGLAFLLAACVIAYTKLRRQKPRSGEGGPDG